MVAAERAATNDMMVSSLLLPLIAAPTGLQATPKAGTIALPVALAPNPRYAGDYLIDFNPGARSTGGGLAMKLAVATDGTVSGSAEITSLSPRDSGGHRVRGVVLDELGGSGQTCIMLQIELSGGTTTLSACGPTSGDLAPIMACDYVRAGKAKRPADRMLRIRPTPEFERRPKGR